MGWLWRDSRGPAWKQGWADQTLASMSAPPWPLVAIFGIIFMLLSLSSYINYRVQMQQNMINFKIFLMFLPVLLIFVAKITWSFKPRTAKHGSADDNTRSFPWSMAALVVVLLALVSYQSRVQSMWSPSL
ncbi:hypothetical protein EZV62_021229 [Acer yangbiense]|uniref:Uncharacterized protein n=1 Tax=Acer yangbiense TaxID=1000413 RepID=A0A5C7H569_9ROSI|nr:hypothetical protein EZV62_021229 [Acer yangbiense]